MATTSSVPPPIDTSGVRTLPKPEALGERASEAGSRPPRNSGTLLGMPAVRESDSARVALETARTQVLPQVKKPATRSNAPAASTRSSDAPPEPPRSKRPPPHPASIRPPQLIASGRYSMSPAAEEVVVTKSRPPSQPVAEANAVESALTSDRPSRRIRHRQATPVQRPHGRRSSPPPAMGKAADDETLRKNIVSAPPPPPVVARSSEPPPLPPKTRSSTPPPPPQGRASVESVPSVAQPKVPRPVPGPGDIPRLSHPDAIAEGLPSVVLDPELEAHAERRASTPPSRPPKRAFGPEAETALIPRAVLDVLPPDAVSGTPRPRAAGQQAWLGLLTVAAVAAAVVALAAHLKQREDAELAPSPQVASMGDAVDPPSAPGATPTSRRIRVESEPLGAHVVYRGAVIGTTPTEVPMPEGEELYLLRMAGHQTQLLQLSSRSDSRIMVVLQPELARAPVDEPAQPAR